MNKKILLFGLVMIFLVNIVYARDIYYNDFEDNNAYGIYARQGVLSIDGTSKVDGTYSLKLDDAGTHDVFEFDFSNATGNNINVSLDIVVNPKAQYQVPMSVGDLNSIANIGNRTAFCMLYQTTKIKCYNGTAWLDTTIDPTAGTKYTVLLELHNDTKKYDVWIDGTKKLSNVHFANNVPIRAISFSSANAGTDIMYLDDIDIKDDAVAIDYFEITASNYYNGTAINTFNVTLTNSSGSLLINTTNGTVFYYPNMMFNISIVSATYIDKSYINHNSSDDLGAYFWQSELYTNAIDINTLSDIFWFNATVGNQFNTSNSTNMTTHYLNAGTYNFTAKAHAYGDNSTGTVTLALGEKKSFTMNFSRDIINVLNFTDAINGTPLSGKSISILTPDSRTLNLVTNSSGQINFSYIYNYNEVYGNYTITYEGDQGYISPIIFTEVINYTNAPIHETYGIGRTNIIINIYDRETEAAITQDVEIIVVGITNVTTSTGQAIISNTTIIADTYLVQAMSEGYFSESQQFEYTGQENITINFYLLNATGTSTGTLFVTTLNEFYITEPDTKVTLLEYNPITLNYITVSECYTNINGECQFSVELNTKRYIITGEKTIAGQLYTDQTSEYGMFINVDEDVIQLFLKLTDQYQVSKTTKLNYDIEDNLNLIRTRNGLTNTTSINITFSTDDGSSTTICLDYYEVSSSGSALVEQDCESSSSGIIQNAYALNRNKTYNIKVYEVVGSTGIIIYNEYVNNLMSFEKTLDDYELLSPLILVPFIILATIALLSRKLFIFFVGAPIASWWFVALFPSIMFSIIAGLITVICIFLGAWSRKKSDPQ